MKQPLQLKLLKLSIILFTLALPGLTSHTIFAASAKHVAVPAKDLATQKLPNAAETGIFSHSSMLPINREQSPSKQGASIKQFIDFDGSSDSPIIFLSPEVENWQMIVTDPNGRKVLDETKLSSNAGQVTNIQVGENTFKGKEILMQSPPVGRWQIELQPIKSLLSKTTKQDQTVGYLMFKGDPEFQLYSHLVDNITTQNKTIAMTTYLTQQHHNSGDRQLMLQSPLIGRSLLNATATVTSPSGKIFQFTLTDSGLNGDINAGDGKFSANVPTGEVGVYTAQIQVQGVRPDGIRFSRTTTDLYRIAAAPYRLSTTSAQLIIAEGEQSRISVPVKKLAGNENVYMAAEVWGTTPQGKLQAAAWVGGLTSTKGRSNRSSLDINFDIRWLTKNNLQAPFKLKSVRLHTANHNVPVAEVKSLALRASKKARRVLSLKPAVLDKSSASVSVIAPDMLMGSNTSAAPIKTAANGKLMLVHGYCSGKIWNTGDFSDSVELVDYKQNRSHEEFAQEILNFGSAYSSYGIVAHSQGGAAALHLYSRYWSGLDNASGGRLIQSLGTPYQGTALAGNAALLGQLFGVGCGPNTDLTYSGAANWLSTIPNWARAEVDYYTTSFKTRWWAYDYCHLATDLFLNDPEDGTTEKWSGQLSGAVNMGHKKGWCHTTGMRDTAQYKDGGRNSSMNSRAAR